MSYIGKGIESVTFNTATTFDVTGDITVGGTVDGRDVAADGTKLDTIAANAIANLSEDTTPQLGGNLDLNINNIIGTGNINVTGSVTGTSFVSTGNMSFTNNSKAIFGTSPSLEIYHDGSNSILDDVGAGNFKMQLAGSDKLEITSTGIDVTGNVTVTGNVSFGDNDKAVFGAGSDLQIYHDGSDSIIKESGSGDLQLWGDDIRLMSADGSETMLRGNPDAQIQLYYNNAVKLATTASGCNITGTVQGDGLVIDGATVLNGNATIDQGALSGNTLSLDRTGASGSLGLFYNGTQGALIQTPSAGGFDFYTGATPTLRMNITSAGNVGIGTGASAIDYNLVVKGSANTNANILAVKDSDNTKMMSVEQTSNGDGRLFVYDTAGNADVLLHTNGNSYFNGGAVVINNSGGDAQLYLGGTSGTSRMYLARSGLDSLLWNVSNGNLRFGTNNTERMRIDSSGVMLLNTTSTSYGGQITARQSGGVSSAAVACINAASSGTRRLIDFFTGTSTTRKGSIESDGTNTSYNTSSDYRLKENVTATWDATTRLKQLNPVRFNFIENADKTVDGFLAHEVQTVVPEAITGEKDAMIDEEYEISAATGDIYTQAVETTYDDDGVELTAAIDEVVHSTDVEQPETLAEGQQWRETTAAVMGTRSVPDYQGIDQSKLVPLLVKTIQELEARITALENT